MLVQFITKIPKKTRTRVYDFNMKSLFVSLALATLVQSAHGLDNGFCFERYGQAFSVDPDILKAISFVESRHNPTALNQNLTTIDYGHMQINSYWIENLLGEHYENLNDPCFCTAIGAYILSSCINSYGLNQDALSCYNSGKSLDLLTSTTRKRVERYITLVQKKFLELKQESPVSRE